MTDFNFIRKQTGTFLSGMPIIDDVLPDEWEFLGAWNPDSPLLFVRNCTTSKVRGFDLGNGIFIGCNIPDVIPQEWAVEAVGAKIIFAHSGDGQYELCWNGKR
jgi:hypothetical protein